MKKLLFSLLTLITFVFSSCNDGEEGTHAYQKFVTVKTLESPNYYFEMDNKKTIYPVNKSNVIYAPKEGQRAILLFSLEDLGKFSQEEQKDLKQYNYLATIYQIQNIYTGAVESMPISETEQQQNDPLDIVDAVLVGDWLTIRVLHPFTSETKNKHSYKVVYDENAFEANSNYINLTLIHNAGDDPQDGSSYYNDISFNTLSIDQFLVSKKGVKITYKRLQTMKTETITIDRPTEKQ